MFLDLPNDIKVMILNLLREKTLIKYIPYGDGEQNHMIFIKDNTLFINSIPIT